MCFTVWACKRASLHVFVDAWEHVCVCDNSPGHFVCIVLEMVSECACVSGKKLLMNSTGLLCSVSFLLPSFSQSEEICLKVAALCYPGATEYNNRRSITCWKSIRKKKKRNESKEN